MRAPFDVRSFGGIYAHDPAIRRTVVRALERAAVDRADVAAAAVLRDTAATEGGWAAFASAAVLAICPSRHLKWQRN